MTAHAFALRSLGLAHRLAHAAGAAIVALADRLLAWQSRARERRMLAEMDDRQLRDLGIRRADAVEEASKPFWRI
jgi:uncharacterized protein YjiS (DUF1127 family)